MDQEFGATGDAEMPIEHRHILMQGGAADAQALAARFSGPPRFRYGGLRYNEGTSLPARRPSAGEMPGRCGYCLAEDTHRPLFGS